MLEAHDAAECIVFRVYVQSVEHALRSLLAELSSLEDELAREVDFTWEKALRLRRLAESGLLQFVNFTDMVPVASNGRDSVRNKSREVVLYMMAKLCEQLPKARPPVKIQKPTEKDYWQARIGAISVNIAEAASQLHPLLEHVQAVLGHKANLSQSLSESLRQMKSCL
jgi:hypothetical protein